MILNTYGRYLNLTDVSIDEEAGSMSGSYDVNLCWSDLGATPNTAGIVCNQPGTFTLNRL